MALEPVNLISPRVGCVAGEKADGEGAVKWERRRNERKPTTKKHEEMVVGGPVTP